MAETGIVLCFFIVSNSLHIPTSPLSVSLPVLGGAVRVRSLRYGNQHHGDEQHHLFCRCGIIHTGS